MEMTMTKPQAGEVWLAEFPFFESAQCKLRPVIVLATTAFGAECAYRTTKFDHLGPGCVVLGEAESRAIGLNSAGVIDFGKRAKVDFTRFKRKLGEMGMPGEKLSVDTWRRLAQAAMDGGM
jgi:hypothetical protein